MAKIAGYCRVSRDDLHNTNQRKVIEDYIKRQGWDGLNCTFFEEVQSTRKTRPIKAKLMQRLREGEYDVLIFARLDRFARSTIELVTDIEAIVDRGVRVISIQNGFDFSKGDYTSTNMLMLRIFSAFAEFERAIIRERTLEGLDRARAWGKIGGRHPKNCGCGFVSKDGKVVHDGHVKPIRDSSNRIIGWEGLKQTPPEKAKTFSEGNPQS